MLPMFEPLFEADLPLAITRQLQIAADTFRSGKLSLLNRGWPTSVLDVSGAVDPGIWRLDPISGGKWPGAEQSAFDADFRFDTEKGDFKYVAEANRLHFLVAPAIHARRTLDAGLADNIIRSLQSWIDANPPGRGINWHSGIELGYRLASLSCIVAALDPWVDAGTGEHLAAFVNVHGTWLTRFPSLYSSANNHLVAEAMGLVLAARMLPHHSHAAAWLASGKTHLEDRTLALFHEDGIGREQSPAYSAFTLEMLLLGFSALGHKPLEPRLSDRLAKAAGALSAFLDDDGLTPSIGDDDQSRVLLAFGTDEPRYMASIVAAVAGYIDRPELSPPIRDPHWRDVVFASPANGNTPLDGTVTFHHGGYTVRRGAIASRRVHLIFDHGPLGFGALAAHGHADALAIWISIDGLPVLVDAGTHLYNREGRHRRRFRVSAVHNTLTIAGASQSEPSGAFNWMPRRAHSSLHSVSTSSQLSVAASHDGYSSRFGVVHHRLITETDYGFNITDRLTGAKLTGEVEIAFLFASQLDVALEDHRVVSRRNGLPELSLVPPEGARIEIVRAEAASGRGFQSPGFGLLDVASTVIMRVPARSMHWKSLMLINPLT